MPPRRFPWIVTPGWIVAGRLRERRRRGDQSTDEKTACGDPAHRGLNPIHRTGWDHSLSRRPLLPASTRLRSSRVSTVHAKTAAPARGSGYDLRGHERVVEHGGIRPAAASMPPMRAGSARAKDAQPGPTKARTGVAR
jgi:hypothetical protein